MSKTALLSATDLVEEDVPLPTIDGKVRVRGLPAAFSGQVMAEAVEYTTDTNGRQGARINVARMGEIQVLNGLIDPKLDSLREVQMFAKRCGPAFNTIVEAIDRLSGVDKDAIEQAEATFPARVEQPDGDDSRTDPAASAPAGGS
jgi:hypothetical protein